jgi:hypothetical protein
MRKSKRNRKKRAKSVKLDPLFWLRNADEIRKYREIELLEQEGKCAITGLPLSNPVLDHSHVAGAGSSGRVRGVLLSEANCLEGKYLKSFQKLKLDTKYGLTFPTFLINMGEYLLQDNSAKPYHYKFMSDLRDQLKRMTKTELISKLSKEFNIESDISTPQRDLVHLYMQTWVDKVEESLK